MIRPVEARAFDCVKFIFIRSGSAVLFSEFGERLARANDVVVLAPNTMCGSHPEGAITTTTIYADLDYLIDQAFWQHSAVLADRHHAREFIATQFPDPAQIIRFGAERMCAVLPWLDQLVELSMEGATSDHFFRMQANLAAVLNALSPFFRSGGPEPNHIAGWGRPSLPRARRFRPVRCEASTIRKLLEEDPSLRWSLNQLAAEVHLSPSQAHRVFLDAYGKTPLAYQALLRIQKMADLLRGSDLSVQDIANTVGWRDRSHAARMFRRLVGASPRRYRQLLSSRGR
ncbi:helix-turn-helix domain-containing protein [Aeromicrobium piscarium]|uniref:Helix-turn-helix domain-containing protein n=1 Tax=Aeromicrobium piscarium TaxID=2590901 RepID=A0A554RFN7_9ACTN|nr:helix-turn-helix domain-containing protein [Aeromicrobium piscarium]